MAVSAASLSHLTAQTEILVEKVIAHTQTGASAVSVDSGNAYTFYSEVIMESGSYTGAFTVGGDNKTLADQGDGEYLFTQSFSSQEDMDTAYANTASYSFTNPGGTSSFTFDQNNGTPTFKHANAPVVTLGGGSWVGNVYQIQNGQSLSVQSTVNDDADAFFMYGWIDLIDSNEIDPHLFSDNIAGGGPLGTGGGNLEINDTYNISLALGQYTVEALHFYGYDLHENDGGSIIGSPPIDGELSGALANYGLGSMTTLTIEVVPEPSQAALLIGIVAIAMVGLRRRVNF